MHLISIMDVKHESNASLANHFHLGNKKADTPVSVK